MGSRSDFGPIHAPILAGVERLANTPLLVNGKTPSVDFEIVGIDATVLSWPKRRGGGAELTISGSGSDPVIAPGPHISEKYVEVTGGQKKYVGSFVSPSTGKDLIHEFVVMPPTPAGATVIVKNNPSNGFQLYHTSVSIALIWYQGSAAVVYAYVAATPGAFSHFLYSLDWGETGSNGYLHYINGVYVGVYDNVSAITSLPNTELEISANTDQRPRVVYAAQHSLAGMLPGGASNRTVMDAVAKERASLVTGHQLLHNHGPLTPDTL